MKRKIPETLTVQELAKLCEATKSKKHRLAYMLGFFGCMRISEICGSKERVTRCCKATISKVKEEVNGRKKTIYKCSKCNNVVEQSNTLKGKEWHIIPLTKENIKEGWINIKGGKGEKDRNIPIAPELKNKLGEVPIGVGVRAIEFAFKKKAAEVLGKDLHFHCLRHCVHEDTEILTLEGWKQYHQLQPNEMILSYDISKDEIVISKVKKVNTYNYSGEAFRLLSNYSDLLMTPEHNLLVNIAHKNNYDAGCHWDSWKLISVGDLLQVKNRRLTKVKNSAIKRQSIYSIGESRAFIFGLILTDACIKLHSGSKKSYEIHIDQSLTANPHKCSQIDKALKESGLEYSRNVQRECIGGYSKHPSEMIRWNLKVSSHKFIFDWINKDRTPKYKLLGLPYNELCALYDAIMLGDGSRGVELTTQNKQRIDFFRALCVCLGKRTKMIHSDKYRTFVCNRTDHNLQPKNIKMENYKGIVWCPQTDTNTWIAKFNEKICITGNSGATYYLNEKKWNIRVVQQFLGHSDIGTTQIYTHVKPEDLFKAMWEKQ